MLRDLVKEGGLYTVANLLTKGISLLLIPFYTSYFGPADYGIIDMLNLFVVFVNAIFTLQLNQGLARYAAESKLSKNQKKLFASASIWFMMITLLTVSLIFIVFPTWIIDLLSNDQRIDTTTFRLATTLMFLNSTFYLLGVLQRFTRKIMQFTIMSFLHSILGIGMILYLALVKDLGINSVYLSYIIIVPPLIIIQFYLLREMIIPKINKRALKKLLRYSIPMIPAVLALAFMNFSDRIFLKEYQSDFGDVGLYAMAARFASILTILISGFTMALGPILFESYSKPETKKQLSRIFKLYVSIGTIGVLVISLFSKEIVTLVTDSAFHGSYVVLPIMLLTTFISGLHMFSLGLNIKKKSAVVALLVTFFAGLNILLNYIFVPRYGLYGAAGSTLLAAASYYVLNFYISQKNYSYEYPKVKLSITLFIISSIIIFISFWQPEIGFKNLLIKLGIVVVYMSVLSIFKLISYREIWALSLSKVFKKSPK